MAIANIGKILRRVLLGGSGYFLAIACTRQNFITPPTQSLGATLNSTSAENHPQFSYDGRYVVFASDRRNSRQIYVYDLQRRQLLPLPGLNQQGILQDRPDISADGRYIVYVSERSGKPDIMVYDRKTYQTETLTRNLLGEVRNPTISGNGRFIAFETNRSGQWDIELYDRGAGIERSTPNPFSNSAPDIPEPAPE
ncbi:MAG: biopolymer transporter [Cyanobacteria bacterium P01_E01_bin.42]